MTHPLAASSAADPMSAAPVADWPDPGPADVDSPGLRRPAGAPSRRPPGEAPSSGGVPSSGGPSSPGSVELVRLAQAGDRSAFEQLVRDTARMLFARLYLETGDRDAADDLVQETYLTAWRSIGQLRDVPDASAFRRWLFAVARTARLDAARREGRKKRGGLRSGSRLRLTGASPEHDDLLAGLNDPGPPPDEALGRRELQEQALALLRSLPEEYRLPIAMRYLSGAEHDTICRQLGLTNGSLRGLLSRGMTRLRMLLTASEA